MSLTDAKVGDKIRITGSSLYKKNVDEVRTITRVMKTFVVDDSGSRWSKHHGSQPDIQYPTLWAELVTDSPAKE